MSLLKKKKLRGPFSSISRLMSSVFDVCLSKSSVACGDQRILRGGPIPWKPPDDGDDAAAASYLVCEKQNVRNHI